MVPAPIREDLWGRKSKKNKAKLTGRKDKTSAKTKLTKTKKKLKTRIPNLSLFSGAGSEKFQVVPWASSSEWENVCTLFNKEEFTSVIREILIWSKRVPAIPIGVESTLYLLQAIVYDDFSTEAADDKKLVWSAEVARSLYSLAIIRYLNHVSHLATKEMGETFSTLPMFKLASYINVPEWIVNLRHEASHGATIPSLEVLRLASTFIKNWLKGNYWISSETIPSQPQEVFLQRKKKTEAQEFEMGRKIVSFISAFVAARVYKLRQYKQITDPEIIQFIPTQASGVDAKKAVVSLKTKIASFLNSDPDQTCSILAEEMIPPTDFYKDLSSIFTRRDSFDTLLLIWNPILKLLDKKDRFFIVFTKLCEIHASEESNEDTSTISAMWLNRLLQKIQERHEISLIEDLRELLPIILTSLKPSSEIFLHRLYQVMELHIGTETVRKLAKLSSIWTNDEQNASTNEKRGRNTKLVTVDDLFNDVLEENSAALPSFNSVKLLELDGRDGEKFWKKIPFGTVFQ